ncbi:AraC family transcriptional regulator [Paenibacillus sp. H1-7]|uniref:helix-turn-helix domain-containing protein n=1 Tax=Paenibacillus sp. H1-7 TaxID=2282849 RepID=UPI001EF8D82E|nr:AraC family transcriptional regulator [Paenibacillus sp. H1-7]
MIGLLRDYVRSFIVLDMPKFLDLLPILEKNCFELTKLSKMKIAGTLDHILTECIEATLAGTEMDFRNQLITLLNSHLNRKLTLSEIARRMSLSESHLERIVNQKFGCGVIDLFNQLRINKACSLLTNSSLRIESISEQLGFYDTAHFSNFFKKKTSMSPKQYREYKRLLL